MRYRYYLDILIPEDERSADLSLVLEQLRYAQVVIVSEKYIRFPCPHGISSPARWQNSNIERMASFGITAEARRQTLQ